MQAKRGANVAEPRPCRRPRLSDPDRVELAFEVAAPEFQKAAQLGKVRSTIELLPDEALQDSRMIRHVVEDLRRRKAVAPQLKVQGAHRQGISVHRTHGQNDHAIIIILPNEKFRNDFNHLAAYGRECCQAA